MFWTRSEAQYVESDDAMPEAPRFLSAGAFWWAFDPRQSNPEGDSIGIRMNQVAPALSYRDGSFDLLFAYTTYSADGGSHPAILFGARLGQDLVLSRSPSGGLAVPVSILGDYTTVEGSGPERETFNVGTVGIGAGLKYRWSGRSVQAWVEGGAVASFAFEAYSLRNGFSSLVFGEAAVLLRKVGPFGGLAIVYRLRLQNWSMSESQFNYRSFMHGPSIGLLF
jgi:hypothetical protein